MVIVIGAAGVMVAPGEAPFLPKMRLPGLENGKFPLRACGRLRHEVDARAGLRHGFGPFDRH